MSARSSSGAAGFVGGRMVQLRDGWPFGAVFFVDGRLVQPSLWCGSGWARLVVRQLLDGRDDSWKVVNFCGSGLLCGAADTPDHRRELSLTTIVARAWSDRCFSLGLLLRSLWWCLLARSVPISWVFARGVAQLCQGTAEPGSLWLQVLRRLQS